MLHGVSRFLKAPGGTGGVLESRGSIGTDSESEKREAKY